MAGLLFAVAFFFLWLRRKGFPEWICLFSALLLLSDTNVTVGAHWYRLDMWVMGLSFLNALLVLRCAGKDESAQLKTLAVVGGLMVTQMFFWITAIIQWPLVIAEVLALAAVEKWTFRRCFRAALAGFAGILVVFVVLLIPLYGEIRNTVQFVFTQTEVGGVIKRFSPQAHEIASSTMFPSVFERMFLFFKLIMRTPFVWMGVLVGCFFMKKHRFHFAALLVCIALVVMTQVYHARVNYITPLAFLFVTEALYQGLFVANKRAIRYASAFILSAALTLSFSLSVIGLNYFARPLSRENTYDALLVKMDETIGRGPKHVYTFTYDIYHVGRKLGWQLFSFLPGAPEALFQIDVSKPLLPDIDFIVVGDDYTLNAEQKAFLRSHGFHSWQRVELPGDQPTGITARFRPVIYARGYPSFTIWKRGL